jgi:formylglycine-generating enzyme required for sulfatase activity
VVKQFLPNQPGSAALKKCIELFTQESKLLQELGKHPQIPDLYAFFEQEDKLYLIQEFIDGENLLTELLKKKRYSEPEVKNFLLELLNIILFIHERKVFHRDIKLENIIRRKDNTLFLIDFGVSKQTSATIMTQMGTTAGTPGYAAPEQMRGMIHPSSDLYSLAVTAVRMLTGCLPEYKNGSTIDQLFDVLNMEWVWKEWLSKNGLSVSSELALILDKMLQDKIANRYQSATEVINALNPQINIPKPLSSSPPNQPAPTFVTTPKPLSSPPPNQPAPTFVTSPETSSPVTQIQTPSISNNIPSLKTFEFDTVIITGITTDFSGDKKVETKTIRKQAQYFTVDLGNNVTLDMVYIPGGTFMMGSPDGKGYDREKPLHRVIFQPFYMGKYFVTQAQWKAIASRTDLKVKMDLVLEPSYFKDPSLSKGGSGGLPVEKVSWEMAAEFCGRLAKLTNKKYRLPSEAQWEYTCRAGTTTPFYFGKTITTDLANYNGNKNYGSGPKGIYREKTTPVGTFPPNAFGLYDMHGNLWEWCADNWHSNYKGCPNDGSAWLEKYTNTFVVRGGSWCNDSNICASAYRNYYVERFGYDFIGFRVVLCVKL